jgi:hypothetical protein
VADCLAEGADVAALPQHARLHAMHRVAQILLVGARDDHRVSQFLHPGHGGKAISRLLQGFPGRAKGIVSHLVDSFLCLTSSGSYALAFRVSSYGAFSVEVTVQEGR